MSFSPPPLSSSPQPPLQPSPGTRRFAIPITPPRWSQALIGINLVVFVAMIVYGYLFFGVWNGTEFGPVQDGFGAKVNQLIAQGEVWRLFTAMFLHSGVIHLLLNLYGLYFLGPLVEGFYGHRRFITIYLLGGLFGSLASYAFVPNDSLGASGAIFGLVGATTVFLLRYREQAGSRGRSLLQNMIILIVINLIFGLNTPGIDNWGHIGGLIGGALVAWGQIPRYLPPMPTLNAPPILIEEERAATEWMWVGICFLLLAAGVGAVTTTLL